MIASESGLLSISAQRRRTASLRARVKSECLDRMILFGERSIHYVLKEYTAHYHLERNHQGIGNNLVIPQPAPEKCNEGKVECRERLGGLLKFYH